MKQRKPILSLALVMILNSISCYAKSGSIMPSSFQKVITFIFETLPQGMRSESALAISYFKMLLVVFVFAVLYSSLKKVMHDNNRTATAVAFVMAFASVILISNDIILKIFKMYSTLISVLLVLLPLFLIVYLAKSLFPKADFKSGWAKGIMLVAASLIILFLAGSILRAGNSQLFAELARWMEIAAVVCFFIGLISFFEGAEGMVKGDYSKDKGGDGGKKNVEKQVLEQKKEKSKKDEEKLDAYGIKYIDKTIERLRMISGDLARMTTPMDKKKVEDNKQILENNVNELIKCERTIKKIEKLIPKVRKKIWKIERKKDKISDDKKGAYEGLQKEYKKERKERKEEKTIEKLEKSYKELLKEVLKSIQNNNWNNAFNNINQAINIKENQKKEFEKYKWILEM